MVRKNTERGAAHAEAPRQPKEKTRAAKAAIAPPRRSPESLAQAKEAEQQRRKGSAEEAYVGIARAVGLDKEPDVARAVQTRIQERKDAILSDVIQSDTKDVSKALHSRMELTALAASLTPEQTDELRSYLDAVDAVESANAAYLKAERTAKQRAAKGEADTFDVGSLNEKADWMDAKNALKGMEAELQASGIDPNKYDFGRKSTRDILRGEKITLKQIGPEEAGTIQSYASALDNADLAHTKAMRVAKKLKSLEASGDRGDEWEATVQEDDAADNDWKAAKRTVSRVEAKLKQEGLDPTAPEFKSKASRTALLAELPGGRVKESDRVLAFEDYDTPTLLKTEKKEERADDDALAGVMEDIGRSNELASRLRKDPDNKDLQQRLNAVDRMVQENVAQWAETYMNEHPLASADEIMDLAVRSGIDEYITKKDVERLHKGVSVENLYVSTGRTESGLKSRELANKQVWEKRQVEHAPDMPESVPLDEWETAETVRKTIVPPKEPKASRGTSPEDVFLNRSKPWRHPVPSAEPVQPPARPSPWAAAKRWGRNMLLPLAVMFGIKSVDVERPDTSAPSREESAEVMADMATMAEPMGEATQAPEAVAAPVVEQTETAAPAKEEGGRVYKKGDPRNLKRALDILKSSGLPGRSDLLKERVDNMRGALQILDESPLPSKAEYLKMKADERKAEFQVAKERMDVLRQLSSSDNPGITAMQRADLKKKLEQHQMFLDLMKSIR